MPLAKSWRVQTVSVCRPGAAAANLSPARGTAAELFMALAAARETDYKIKLL